MTGELWPIIAPAGETTRSQQGGAEIQAAVAVCLFNHLYDQTPNTPSRIDNVTTVDGLGMTVEAAVVTVILSATKKGTLHAITVQLVAGVPDRNRVSQFRTHSSRCETEGP